jgi:hypothetical protein
VTGVGGLLSDQQGELQLDLAPFMQLVLKAASEAGVPHDGRPQALHPDASADEGFVPLEEQIGTTGWLGPIDAESAANRPPALSGHPAAHASMLLGESAGDLIASYASGSWTMRERESIGAAGSHSVYGGDGAQVVLRSAPPARCVAPGRGSGCVSRASCRAAPRASRRCWG